MVFFQTLLVRLYKSKCTKVSIFHEHFCDLLSLAFAVFFSQRRVVVKSELCGSQAFKRLFFAGIFQSNCTLGVKSEMVEKFFKPHQQTMANCGAPCA